MAGIRGLRKLQLGQESTAGTAVAATTIWRGMGTLKDDREIIFPEEDVAYISGIDRSLTPKLQASLSMDEIVCNFEQVPYLLEAGIQTATPTTEGSGYLYTYTLPTTAKKTIKTYTIEGGDDQEAERMEYSFVQSLSIGGEAGGPLNMSAEWVGRQAAVNAFTGALSVPAVEDIPFSVGSLYIDDVSGTHGSTQVSSTIISASLNLTTGWVPRFTLSGQKYFSSHEFNAGALEAMLELTFLHNSSAASEKVNWRAETARKIRLEWLGTALTTAGSTFSNKALQMDLVGKWQSFDKLDENEGNDVIAGQFRCRYNATAASFGILRVVNNLSALT